MTTVSGHSPNIMIKTYQSIDKAVGNTPLVEIRRLNPNNRIRIFAKLEYLNPGGSIKDRVAVHMIEQAEKRGELTKDKVILEATSGNTGIGLALVAASKGYRLCLAMPESASEERKRILKALGAELVLTPANQRTDGAIEVAYHLMREHPTDILYRPVQQCRQRGAHYHGTGEEISGRRKAMSQWLLRPWAPAVRPWGSPGDSRNIIRLSES